MREEFTGLGFGADPSLDHGFGIENHGLWKLIIYELLATSTTSRLYTNIIYHFYCRKRPTVKVFSSK